MIGATPVQPIWVLRREKPRPRENNLPPADTHEVNVVNGASLPSIHQIAHSHCSEPSARCQHTSKQPLLALCPTDCRWRRCSVRIGSIVYEHKLHKVSQNARESFTRWRAVSSSPLSVLLPTLHRRSLLVNLAEFQLRQG